MYTNVIEESLNSQLVQASCVSRISYLTRRMGSRFHETCSPLLLRSKFTTESARVISEFPLQIHRKCAPDNFLCVRGTTTSRMGGGGYDDRRVRGDKRLIRIRARGAPPSGKSRRSKERCIGNLTHFIRGGYPVAYLFAAAAAAALDTISTLPSS